MPISKQTNPRRHACAKTSLRYFTPVQASVCLSVCRACLRSGLVRTRPRHGGSVWKGLRHAGSIYKECGMPGWSGKRCSAPGPSGLEVLIRAFLKLCPIRTRSPMLTKHIVQKCPKCFGVQKLPENFSLNISRTFLKFKLRTFLKLCPIRSPMLTKNVFQKCPNCFGVQKLAENFSLNISL